MTKLFSNLNMLKREEVLGFPFEPRSSLRYWEMAKLLIMGVGNPMYGDDALGYCIGRAIEKCLEHRSSSDKINIIEKQTITIADAALLEDHDIILIIDSSNEIEQEYQLFKITGKQEELEKLAVPRDSHSVTPLNLVAAASSTNILKGEVYLYLVKPYKLDFGSGLTREAARRAYDAVIDLCSRIKRIKCEVNKVCIKKKLEECINNPLID